MSVTRLRAREIGWFLDQVDPIIQRSWFLTLHNERVLCGSNAHIYWVHQIEAERRQEGGREMRPRVSQSVSQ